MKLQSLDNNIDDEPDCLDQDNNEHEETETATNGARLIKHNLERTADHTTVSANPLDTDLLPATVPEQDQVEVRRGKKAEDDEEIESEFPRAIAPANVKKQNKENLAAALADFGKLPKLPKEPANDNFRPTVSWPLMDQLTRNTFEPDKERRTKNIISARYLRELIDTAEADSLGSSVYLPGKSAPTDFDMQRT